MSNDAPERVWLYIPDGWINWIAQREPIEHGVEYVRADLAAPDAAQFDAEGCADAISKYIADERRHAKREVWKEAIARCRKVAERSQYMKVTTDVDNAVLQAEIGIANFLAGQFELEAAALRAEGEKG